MGFKQGFLVGLPVWRQRYLIYQHVPGGQHVIRQDGLDLFLHGRNHGVIVDQVVLVDDQERDDLFSGWIAWRRDVDNSLPDTGQSQELILDFAQLDTIPADLDLLVAPAKELDLSVRQASCKITTAVKALPVAHDELLARQRAVVQVAPGHARPADEEFPYFAGGNLG